MLIFYVADSKIKIKLSKKDLHHVDEASLAAETSQSPAHNHSPTSNHQATSLKVRTTMGWDISNESLKPRVFCLEHAIEVEELLSSRGGASVLVICHSGRLLDLVYQNKTIHLMVTDRFTIHIPEFL